MCPHTSLLSDAPLVVIAEGVLFFLLCSGLLDVVVLVMIRKVYTTCNKKNCLQGTLYCEIDSVMYVNLPQRRILAR
jgi:hypothetical protein